MSPLGQPIPHDSADGHVRGTAAYLDDWPPLRGELVVDFVGSPVAHGKLLAVHADDARQVDGVVAVLTAADVPENATGPGFHDEQALAAERVPSAGTVQCVGRPVGAAAGPSRAAVAAARNLVRVDVEPLPAVLTIPDAIAHGQFIGPTRRIARGDATAALATAEERLVGEL